MKKSNPDLDALLRPYTPFRADLFHAVRPHVTDEMLADISVADYGSDQRKHFAALRRIRDTGYYDGREWIPREVLQLAGYNIGQGEPESHDRCIIRVFCNATRLSPAPPDRPSETPLSDIGALLELLPVIQEQNWISALQNTLAALVIEDATDDDRLLYFFALLLVGVEAGDRYSSDQHLREIIDWIEHDEERLLREYPRPRAYKYWLLGHDESTSSRTGPWFQTCRRLLIDQPIDRQEPLKSKLVEVGRRVAAVHR